MSNIIIRGARTHNLRNVNVTIPRDKLVVVTGLSGSGKSSLAFNTLYAEGQRRYVESLSSYARQFLSVMEKPDVDHIEGLSPAISIEQKSTSHNPRSTVGTITEIYDYLRLLYARVGSPHCPYHHVSLAAQTVTQMVDSAMALPVDSKIMLLAPLVINRKGEYQKLLDNLQKQGFVKVRIDNVVYDLDAPPKLNVKQKHDIAALVDRIKIRPGIEQRLAESFETALKLSDGIVKVAFIDEAKADILFSAKHACPECDYSLPELAPRLFSFNNPIGACAECDGLGVKQFFDLNKIIYDEELSLSAGAIRGWGRDNIYYFEILEALAKHYKFKLDTPYKKLPEKIKKIILYGSGTEKIKFRYAKYDNVHVFEGVLPSMERRYKETESELVRENLAKFLTLQECKECNGDRLNINARNVFVANKNLPAVANMTIEDATDFFCKLSLPGHKGEIASRIVKEISERLSFLENVGLEYLTLARSAETLSGGEAQRIRLASQIGAGLVGVMYVLDEPSIGLHQRDNARLLKTLEHLRDLGNTVIVIEHDYDAIMAADHVIDIGPGAGVHGGEIVAEGKPSAIKNNPKSLTGQYLAGIKKIAVPQKRAAANKDKILTLIGVTCNNLKNVNVKIPVGLFTCVTGVSGSGKSSLINDTLFPLAFNKINRANHLVLGSYKEISGLEHIDKVIDIDQSPIGRTPRSNPATYTGIFTPVRELFAQIPEARTRGYQAGRFSFNVAGGRCEACCGDGAIKVEMHFLADIYVTCDQCKGKRYNRETLDIKYKGKNIHEVLDMTIEDAKEFFAAIPMIARKLQTLIDVGLSYIKLGQSAVTLSGGEAQRIKLSRELSKRDTGNTLYLLDEPTTGLHFHDVNQLLKVLHTLRDHGNTVVVIEHNLDVIKTADYIIDLGPEGGAKGGKIIATGTPEEVAEQSTSYTGQFLRAVLDAPV